jgi:hypothetical protein
MVRQMKMKMKWIVLSGIYPRLQLFSRSNDSRMIVTIFCTYSFRS